MPKKPQDEKMIIAEELLDNIKDESRLEGALKYREPLNEADFRIDAIGISLNEKGKIQKSKDKMFEVIQKNESNAKDFDLFNPLSGVFILRADDHVIEKEEREE